MSRISSVVRSTLASTTVELFDQVMAINVRAPMLLIGAAREALGKSKGAVLNIGSLNGYCGEGNLLAYSISKGALHTLSRNLADAWATSQVRVNHFVLGWVLTRNEYQRKLDDGLTQDWHLSPPPADVPFGKLTTPETIAAAALYWCSADSWPLSGNTIELEQHTLIGRNPVKRGSEAL